jgi:hypothetical protein
VLVVLWDHGCVGLLFVTASGVRYSIAKRTPAVPFEKGETMIQMAIAFCIGLAVTSFAFAQDNCLNKSEMVISQNTTYGPCVLTEPLEIRTKSLYCEDRLLDQWQYWAGKYEQKEKTVSKVLIQITNTCTHQVVHSETENRVSEKKGEYEIADTRSLYPDASNWFVNRHPNKIDSILANDCGSFPEGTKKTERGDLLSVSEARKAFEQERLNCESDPH